MENKNEQIKKEDYDIMNRIDKKKSEFINNLMNDTEEENISIDEFNQLLTSRNKNGVFKELLNYFDDAIDEPKKLNIVLMELMKTGQNLTYEMLTKKEGLKKFKDYLQKTASKKARDSYIIKSVIDRKNIMYLIKTKRL